MNVEEILRILADHRNMRPRPQVSLKIIKRRSGLHIREIYRESDILACAQRLVGSESHPHASRRDGPTGIRIERNRGATGSLHVHAERLDVVPAADRCEVRKESVITSMGKDMSDT